MFKMNGLGIDIVDLSRHEFDDRQFAKRYMTKLEYENFLCCESKQAQRNYMGCIWSLKEAIIKAINHEYLFSEIEIILTKEAPMCQLKNHTLFLSVSFEKTIVVAIAIGFKNPNGNEL